ncbi:hypothetical protein VZT92_018423 [Zoarces viviparus]|uniref:Ig-like domain-containing protein n=1 Tax=Zoarces viviparus TaxID=48416 RepID=A0AAW1EKC2_ZOAVI
MCHVTDRQCGAFTVLVFPAVVFLVLIRSCSSQSEPIGPSQPIVGMVGDDTVLPCQLVPVMNAFVMTVEWARRDLDPRFVLLWRDGEELASKKHPSYRGRTSLSTDRLEHGDVSLKLSSVRISDEGRYRCFIPDLQKSPTVQLVVGAVSSPQILMTETSNGNMLLQCDAKGWYPEPEVVWLDGEGDHVPGPAEILRGPDGLYAVNSSLTVEKRGGHFTCRVQQKTTNQTRETHLQVPDHSFMVLSPRVLIGSIIGCAALLFILAVLFVVWKRQQKKRKTKRRSLEDGAEQTEEVKEVTSNGDNTGVQEHVSLLAEGEAENNETELIQSDNVEWRAEELPLIPTEGETHQKQDMKNEGEGGQTMKPVKEDSGRSLELVEDGQKEQQTNVHAAQEVWKRNITRTKEEEPKEKLKETKKEKDDNVKESEAQENIQIDGENTDLETQEEERRRRQTGMQEREEMETKKENDENKKTLQSELKTQEIVAVKDQEGNQSEITRTTERKEENQKETQEMRDVNVEESEKQGQMVKDNIELKPQEGKEHLLGDQNQEGSNADMRIRK